LIHATNTTLAFEKARLHIGHILKGLPEQYLHSARVSLLILIKSGRLPFFSSSSFEDKLFRHIGSGTGGHVFDIVYRDTLESTGKCIKLVLQRVENQHHYDPINNRFVTHEEHNASATKASTLNPSWHSSQEFSYPQDFRHPSTTRPKFELFLLKKCDITLTDYLVDKTPTGVDVFRSSWSILSILEGVVRESITCVDFHCNNAMAVYVKDSTRIRKLYVFPSIILTHSSLILRVAERRDYSLPTTLTRFEGTRIHSILVYILARLYTVDSMM
jgi:hypothetical protein